MTTPVTRITFACHGCGREFSVPANFVGRKATCKTCGTRVVVPAESEVNAPVAVGAEVADNGEAVAHAESHEHEVVNVVSANEDVAESAPTISEDPTIPKVEVNVATAEAAEPEAPVPSAPKVPMRIRRLMVDADQVKKAFSLDGPIRVKNTVGDPPELYQVEYKVKSLQRGWLGKPKKRDSHLVEIQLTSEYPRMAPQCRMLTPVFHPNIDETTVCVGDHWTAGERLVDLIIRIGQMLAYQDYNIKSPLNGEAAMWADLNPTKLPTDPQNLHLADAL